MNFTSQICTTKEQSERLLALGLKKETSDMVLQKNHFGEWLPSTITECPFDDWIFPAWSLHRLIELSGMGIFYSSTNDIYDKVIQYIEFLVKCDDFNKEYLN